MKIKGKDIVVTSNEPWGDIWYSKQNYAFELSRNNRVVFINPPSKWTIRNLISLNIKRIDVSDNLCYLDYSNWIPTRWSLLNQINNFIVSFILKRFLKKSNYNSFLFWAFDPIRLYNPKLLGASISVYHCVDYYYFKFYGEFQLCANSDFLFATSQLFLDEFRAFNKPKHVVPHGISQDEFIINHKRETELNIPFANYGLYIGVIDHRMDFEFYENVIQTFDQTQFVFVGPIRKIVNEAGKRIFEENKYPNVVLAGPKHFKDLKYFIAKSSFCMSFMDMSYHANTVHHHKTLVYLAQGKPVFSFEFEEYKSNGDIMYISNDHAELKRKMTQFIKKGEPIELFDNRIKYASKYTFENILESAGDILLTK